MWEAWIHNTRSGSPELALKTSGPLVGASWNRVLGSHGSGTHLLNLHSAGIPVSMLNELQRGNKYSISHRWGSHVSYAGVIQNTRFIESGSVLKINTNELRKAMLGVRNPYGVNEYNPSAGAMPAVNRSRTGAVRMVLQAATKANLVPGWELPIDLPPMSDGNFNAAWRHEEKLTTDHLLRQIEADGVETDLVPYVTEDGYLRYEARVALQITNGSPFVIAARAPGSIVADLEVERDSVAQRTGLIGFGKGQGQDAFHTFAPLTGDGIGDLPVMDSMVSFPDIDDLERLQRATNTEFERRRAPVEQWDYRLFIGGVGPAMTAPGAIHDMHVFGSKGITDGSHPQRVISLSGGLSYMVKPGVQSYGG